VSTILEKIYFHNQGHSDLHNFPVGIYVVLDRFRVNLNSGEHDVARIGIANVALQKLGANGVGPAMTGCFIDLDPIGKEIRCIERILGVEESRHSDTTVFTFSLSDEPVAWLDFDTVEEAVVPLISQTAHDALTNIVLPELNKMIESMQRISKALKIIYPEVRI
jgi:hypothetical protein